MPEAPPKVSAEAASQTAHRNTTHSAAGLQVVVRHLYVPISSRWARRPPQYLSDELLLFGGLRHAVDLQVKLSEGRLGVTLRFRCRFAPD